jgi:uncharacterized protein YodC (DUF2158 family)
MKCLELRLFIGAQVQLKSGGFPMTVEAIEGDNVTCVWADKNRILRDVLKSMTLKNSTAGADMIRIIPGINATEAEVLEHQVLSEALGNA